jgi:tRNA (guanosine-2'-O-)-methyltransferase
VCFPHAADDPRPCLALWFGNEGRGIRDEAVEASGCCVSIPMFGMVESLNLGTTTGIVLYEITKQRREYQRRYKRANRGPSRRSRRT